MTDEQTVEQLKNSLQKAERLIERLMASGEIPELEGIREEILGAIEQVSELEFDVDGQLVSEEESEEDDDEWDEDEDWDEDDADEDTDDEDQGN